MLLVVVVERFSRTDLPEMEKRKFLVPRDMFVGQFIHILRSRMHLPSGKALFIFIQDTFPQTASIMDSMYQQYKMRMDSFTCATEIAKYKEEIQKLQASEAEIKALSFNYAAMLKEKEHAFLKQEDGEQSPYSEWNITGTYKG
uniref:Autophagy-related protein n=1 Tax=Ananas comosus var. bracteatus TaxID=296719 RepID=A0A6V7QLG2_ANACO|nr:unnamed protein product [Ananas comosus var. bracteatus]